MAMGMSGSQLWLAWLFYPVVLFLVVENMELTMAFYDERAVMIELPNSVDLEVTDTPPPHKGDTSSGGTKPATLSNGMTVNVPFFMKAGDMVRIDTRTGNYLERVRA